MSDVRSAQQFGGVNIAMAIARDEAEGEKVRNPQPGQRIYRGEVREFDQSIPEWSGNTPHSAVRQVLSDRTITGKPVQTVGQHWTTNPKTPVEFAGTGSIRPVPSEEPWGRVHVQWEGVLDDPEMQVENRGGAYGPGHWERELRLKEHAPVRITGAKYYVSNKPEHEGESLWSQSPHWQHVTFAHERFPAVTTGRGVRADIPTWAEGAEKIGAPQELVQRALSEHEYWNRARETR